MVYPVIIGISVSYTNCVYVFQALYIDYDNPTEDTTTVYNKLDDLRPEIEKPSSVSSAENLAMSVRDET